MPLHHSTGVLKQDAEDKDTLIETVKAPCGLDSQAPRSLTGRKSSGTIRPEAARTS
jgi:hypothetical protein